MKKASTSLNIGNRILEIAEELSLDGSTDTIKNLASAIVSGSVVATGSALFPFVGCFLLYSVISQFSKSKDKAILKELNEEFNKLTKALPDNLEKIRDTQLVELEKILNIEIGQKKLITIAHELHTNAKINQRNLDEISENLNFSIDEIKKFYLTINELLSEMKSMFSDAQQERLEHEHESKKRHKELLSAIKKEVSPENIGNRNATILNKSFDLSEELPEIPREEVEKIWEILWSYTEKKSVLLSGKAGIGKSGIMHQLSVKLNKEDIPFLYIKLDAIDQVDTTMKLGEQLFCGIAQSPVNVLAALFPKKDVVIIIDQLDELSEVSGRSPEFFSCIDLLLKEARRYTNMRFVLACREFDLENDFRLRAIKGPNGIARELKAMPLSEDIVKQIVEAIGFSEMLLTSRQLELLQNPLHLFLLVQTSDSFEKGKVLDFLTVNDLYKRYWTKKKGETARRMKGKNCYWEEVIDRITEYMSSYQKLMISKYLMDNYSFTFNAMISEHILVESGNNVAFFHSTFFDYAFARRFCVQGKDLVKDILLKEEQHLFRRDQIRQVLHLLREIDPDKYYQTLQELLGNKKIRYHLKKTTTQYLQLLNLPTKQEYEIIKPFLYSKDDALCRDLQNSLFFSPQWLKLFYRLNLIIPWLEDDDKRFELIQGIIILSNNVPEIMISILEHFGNSIIDLVPNEISFLNALAQLEDQELFNKFIEFVDTGYFDNLQESENNIWSICDDLPEKQSDKAAEIIGHYLKRRAQELSDNLNNGYKVFKDETNACSCILKISKNSPEKYLQYVFPIFLHILKKFFKANETFEGFPLTLAWRFRIFRDYDPHQVDDAILMGLENALCQLAFKNSEQFEKYKNDLMSANFEPANFLLIRAFTSGGKHYADEAIEYVCEKTYRLQSDWTVGGGEGDIQYWPGYELLNTCTHFCSDETLCLLEETLLNIRVLVSLDHKSFQYYQDYFQFMLISGVIADRRSDNLNKKLFELQRKLNKKNPIKPIISSGEVVDSPIESKKAEKMSDEQWLKAIAKYNTDKVEYRSGGLLKGGSIELSRVLGEETKKDPKRFCNLLLQFPEDTNINYFNQVLIALATPICKAQKEDVFTVVKRCHELYEYPCGQWICRLISKFSKEEIFDEILDIVSWYAKAPNSSENCNGYGLSSSHAFIQEGINSVRGVATESIALLSWDNYERQLYFKSQIFSLVKDYSLSVRALAAKILCGMLSENRKQAIDLFFKLCNTDDDRLLATQYVGKFIICSLHQNFDQIFPFVLRMVSSSIPEVRESGARILTGFRLEHDYVHEDFEKCLNSGNESLLVGIATVVVDYVGNKNFTKFCQSVLIKLFNDSSEKVIQKATRCFYNLQVHTDIEYIPLIKNFLKSSSFKQYSGRLISCLDETITQLPDITFEICKKILELNQKDLQYRTNFYGGGTLSTLLFRLYKQTQSADIKTRCLDTIDELLKVNLWGIENELQKFNR